MSSVRLCIKDKKRRISGETHGGCAIRIACSINEKTKSIESLLDASKKLGKADHFYLRGKFDGDRMDPVTKKTTEHNDFWMRDLTVEELERLVPYYCETPIDAGLIIIDIPNKKIISEQDYDQIYYKGFQPYHNGLYLESKNYKSYQIPLDWKIIDHGKPVEKQKSLYAALKYISLSFDESVKIDGKTVTSEQLKKMLMQEWVKEKVFPML